MVTLGRGLGRGDPVEAEDSSEEDGSVMELVRDVRGSGVGTTVVNLEDPF